MRNETLDIVFPVRVVSRIATQLAKSIERQLVALPFCVYEYPDKVSDSMSVVQCITKNHLQRNYTVVGRLPLVVAGITFASAYQHHYGNPIANSAALLRK